MKIDPHGHKERYLAWKERTKNGIEGISKANSDIIKQFVLNMELGLNVSMKSKKGARSYIRLNTLREKMMFFARTLQERFNLNCITDVTEEQLHSLFMDMRNGTILRQDGKVYAAPGYYVKSFKAFWHWYMQIQRKLNKQIEDITSYLDARQEKPKWVYLTEDQVRKLCDNAKYEYRVLMMFLLDSGIRSPTELVNVKVGDFYEDYKRVEIRDEASKTFGRKINLLLCPALIKQYVEEKGLKKEDYIFPICSKVAIKYLKRLAKRVLGDDISAGGERYSQLTLYDFRHTSACYWLPRYKSETALKYRFGWKKSEMIHYYTEFLGMKDTISQEDVLLDVTKTELEKNLSKANKENEILDEKVKTMEVQMVEISKKLRELEELELSRRIKVVQIPERRCVSQ